MRYTGEKPVDPLIVNVWPLKPGSTSSYPVYEDSGLSVEYQRGVFARTPVKATQTGDRLLVEIGPVQGGYPGMPKARGFELRLPADWPPTAVTVNGVPVRQAGPAGKGGWTFEGNTLTTVIPVPSRSVATKLVVEVRRAAGLTARRNELDGFAGLMTRLRDIYDALHQAEPVAWEPDILVDAVQTGDRLGYYPGRIQEELVHCRQVLPQALTAVKELDASFDRLSVKYDERMHRESWRPSETDAQRQRRRDAMTRANLLMVEVGK
jgi:alpha-glucosidase